MTSFQLVELEGEPYERGRLYGARLSAAIRHNVEAYLHLFRFHAGLDAGAARRKASAFVPLIEAQTPQLLLEMRGIAHGAGCELVDLLLLNARSELMSGAEECTALAAGPDAASEGGVLLGQNWDWYTAAAPEPVLLCIRGERPGQPDILTLVEAGQVGKIGLNSAGLGLCLNFLEHTDGGQGLPLHLILRQMLGCASLGDAIHLACSLPRAAAANVLLAHAEGDILDLELTATAVDFLYADKGWLVHANHFESPRLRGGDTGLLKSRSTLARAARARRLLAQARGTASLDTFRSILADHAYGPYAICRHPDPGEPDLQQTATRASLIMDLTARTLHLACGQPCQEPYQSYTCPAPIS